jgi:hypothetical protein
MDAPLMVNGRYCLHYFGTWMPLGEVGVHSITIIRCFRIYSSQLSQFRNITVSMYGRVYNQPTKTGNFMH